MLVWGGTAVKLGGRGPTLTDLIGILFFSVLSFSIPEGHHSVAVLACIVQLLRVKLYKSVPSYRSDLWGWPGCLESR